MPRNHDYPLYDAPDIHNLQELVRYVATTYADRPAFTYRDQGHTTRISYRQFAADVDALGTALINLGSTDTHVAVIGKNSYQWILTYFAVVNTGQVIVPLDPELTDTEITTLLETSDTDTLIYDDDFTDLADALPESLPTLRLIPMSQLPNLIRQGTALIAEGTTPATKVPINAEALMAILFTSGTTGAMKGVMLTHRNITIDAVAACRNLELTGRYLHVLPLHHSFGLISMCFMLLKCCEVCINSSLRRIPTDLDHFSPQLLVVVPLLIETFHRQIWDTAEKQSKAGLLRFLITVSNTLQPVGIDLRRRLFKSVLDGFGGNLTTIVCGGAPLDKNLVKNFRDFGVEVLNGYGITECSPVVSVSRNHHYRDGSAGSPLLSCKVIILQPDETGIGEICVKGDVVMLGYYKDDQATKDAFDGEWFKTGDIGYIDKDGFLFITGRKKNLIIRSNGKNVSAEELESSILQSIPYVLETVVKADGDAIVAEVYLDPDTPDAASRLSADITRLNRTLASYKNIDRTVVRSSESPKTSTKKIRR